MGAEFMKKICAVATTFSVCLGSFLVNSQAFAETNQFGPEYGRTVKSSKQPVTRSNNQFGPSMGAPVASLGLSTGAPVELGEYGRT